MYLKDPKNGKGSVSLTLMMTSFAICVTASASFILGHIDTIGPVMELFYSTAALYFGRRFKIKTDKLEVEGETEQR